MHDDNDDASGPTFLQALQHRHKLAVKVFAAVFLVAGAIALLTRQYSAYAVVALNPAAAQTSDGRPKSAVELAWAALPDKQIGDIIDRLRLDTAMARLRAQGDVFTYLRSKFLLRQLDSPRSPAPEVVISYTGDQESSTIQAANAAAQVLASVRYNTDAHPAPADSPETTRSSTQQLSQSSDTEPLSQNSDTQPPPQSSNAQPLPQNSNTHQVSQNDNAALTEADLQRNLKIGAQLQGALEDATRKLAALQQESNRSLTATETPHAPPPPPPQVHQDPRRLALEQQIRQAQSHLNDLLERYTNDYPDVQDAREALSDLQAKLNRVPPEKPQPEAPRVAAPSLPTSSHAASLNEIAQQQDELRARQSDLEQKIRENQQDNRMLRSRLAELKAGAADSKTTVKDDGLKQQQHNNAALQGQDAAANSAPATPEIAQGPLFIVVKTATTADALGLFPKPLFWFATLLVALIGASTAVVLAARFAPLDEEMDDYETYYEQDEETDEENSSRSLHTR